MTAPDLDSEAPINDDTAAGIAASYFDGKTSRRHAVKLQVRGELAILSGESQRQCPLAQLHVSERTSKAARKVTYPDGAYLEIINHAAFAAMLADTGHRDGMVVTLQQSWRGSLIALGVTVVVLILGYLYALPLAAQLFAHALPVSIERNISREALTYVDGKLFSPSALPAARRQQISERFAALRAPRPDAPPYTLLFRKSKIGPNAFALPSGQIVLTDEIVTLLDNDEAVMGVLAHELGHLHERHLMRRLIQNSTIAATATVLLGDVSAVIATIPTLLLDMRYSRDAEREADDYAIAMFKANDLPLASLARVFEKLDGNKEPGNPYLSSHPSGAERVERIRRMAQE